MTLQALLFYAPGILGYSAVKIASPSFYALRDARTPVIVSVVTVVINLALNLILHGIMGFRGLALGTSIAATFNAGVLLVLLSRRIGGVDAPRLAVSLAKIAVATALMGWAAWASRWARAWWPGGSTVANSCASSARCSSRWPSSPARPRCSGSRSSGRSCAACERVWAAASPARSPSTQHRSASIDP